MNLTGAKKLTNRSGVVWGVLGFIMLLVTSINVSAAPPRKDICPAPKVNAKRSAAVDRACRYFGQTRQGWGLHSAFNRRGKVITCLHFTCRVPARKLIPR